ncbi:hypothetical protein FACS1894205_4290 [Alphaproteobacteria bacterium]|nr:hypothetical protein FACS1894205_4290 [Alphaproteobacteria bacterium]
MPTRRLFLAFSIVLLGVKIAAADCTQPPGPSVDWSRCLVNGRDLSGHDFTASRLVEASFPRATLNRVILTNVNGYRAKFISASMIEAVLDGGSFPDADLTKADLSGASLKNADFRRARFFATNLARADLSGAKMERADLTGANLSGTRWIDGERICAEGSIGQCN